MPRSSAIEGEPDILIPSVDAYLDPKIPVNRLCMVGVKTTMPLRAR